MYHYYTYDGRTLCSAGALPYPEISALPETGEVLWVFHRPPLAGRDTFPVTDPAQLTEREGVASLCAAPGPEGLPRELTNAIRAGRVRAVNLAHPRFEELMAPLPRPEKVRVNLLALGDVGSTLLMGLRLMGGDVISSIGICDLREGVAQRWEFELNQIQLPGPYDALPPVEIVSPEQLFDGDVFLFCASRFVPDTAVKTGDVRMAQYRLNRELAALYAQKARQARYRGPPVPGGADGEQPRPVGGNGLSGPVFPPGPGLRPGGHERPGGVLCPEGPPLCLLPDRGPQLRPPRGGPGDRQFHPKL